jgi:hypothetical protein
MISIIIEFYTLNANKEGLNVSMNQLGVKQTTDIQEKFYKKHEWNNQERDKEQN